MNGHKSMLLVEDDDVDARVVRRALTDLQVANPLVRARHGEEALDWLRDHEEPGLILLDLNMPVMNGVEFLRLIKGDVRLRSIPVVVLTTSALEADRLTTFDLSVAGYMIKPIDYRQFVEVMRAIHMYWTLSESP